MRRLAIAKGVQVPIALFVCALSSPAWAYFPDCAEAEELLTGKSWKNFENGEIYQFSKTGPLKGTRTVDTQYESRYSLRPLRLVENHGEKTAERVCQITVNLPLNGDCAGDVAGYFIEVVGESVQFRTGFDGWVPDSIWKVCDPAKTYSIAPTR
ncbi:hypothetical protein [Paraburkholderia sediminicola]|uniref:hypothetical protein n=1 Tax=Paraburkholderia sediminicola TaxID=458836 RepID=UPI0038B9AE4A